MRLAPFCRPEGFRRSFPGKIFPVRFMPGKDSHRLRGILSGLIFTRRKKLQETNFQGPFIRLRASPGRVFRPSQKKERKEYDY
jgi:hypothetical protein